MLSTFFASPPPNGWQLGFTSRFIWRPGVPVGDNTGVQQWALTDLLGERPAFYPLNTFRVAGGRPLPFPHHLFVSNARTMYTELQRHCACVRPCEMKQPHETSPMGAVSIECTAPFHKNNHAQKPVRASTHPFTHRKEAWWGFWWIHQVSWNLKIARCELLPGQPADYAASAQCRHGAGDPA